MSVLNRMREEDPTWVIEQSKELRQTLVHGQGEFHLRTFVITSYSIHYTKLYDAGMSNSEMLNYQLDKFREVMESYKSKSGQKSYNFV